MVMGHSGANNNNNNNNNVPTRDLISVPAPLDAYSASTLITDSFCFSDEDADL